MFYILAFSAFTTSKTSKETFNIAPGRPKGPRRGVEEGPKTAHEAPETAQEGPQTAAVGPKTPPA
eukprot:4078172-Pyramimonas_sp.AAC.1